MDTCINYELFALAESADGLDLVFVLADVEFGENARISDAFVVEGTAELNESAFSFEGFTLTFTRTGDGKVKATITLDGAPAVFFLRVKMK
ncbi:MAG: hypothetical protein IJI73_02185 [Kiritimatiellae bacterium]|nr:hypothetical protein [Kiritimatiellia bacterium]